MDAESTARYVGAEPATQEPVVSRTFVAHAVYGLITVLAALHALEVHPPSAWRGAVILFGTTLAVALLDAYSLTIAEMLARKERLSGEEMLEIGRDVAPVMVGAQGPTLVMILSAFGLFTVENAIDIAQGVALVSLFGYGWRIGKLLHERWPMQLLNGVLLVAIGGLLVGIKAVFH
jgi:hemolysin III